MNLDKVLNVKIAPVEQTLNEKDCMLYALGIGLGDDPVDPRQLQFVYENGLKVFPSQAVVVAFPGLWISRPELEVDWLKMLHGEQAVTQLKPLQPGHTYIGEVKVLGVVDKGADKGAVLYYEKTLTDKASGELTTRVMTSVFLRGDGGCGDSGYQPPPQVVMPERAADKSVAIATARNAALIYRLSADYNPIHIDPEKAKKAGFDRPILHGLCVFGIATRAILDTYCNADPERLAFIGLRFSKPVYPGETIRVNLWEEGNEINFSAEVVERGVKVLDLGRAYLR